MSSEYRFIVSATRNSAWSASRPTLLASTSNLAWTSSSSIRVLSPADCRGCRAKGATPEAWPNKTAIHGSSFIGLQAVGVLLAVPAVFSVFFAVPLQGNYWWRRFQAICDPQMYPFAASGGISLLRRFQKASAPPALLSNCLHPLFRSLSVAQLRHSGPRTSHRIARELGRQQSFPIPCAHRAPDCLAIESLRPGESWS